MCVGIGTRRGKENEILLLPYPYMIYMFIGVGCYMYIEVRKKQDLAFFPTPSYMSVIVWAYKIPISCTDFPLF